MTDPTGQDDAVALNGMSVSLHCEHGRWVGSPQFGACHECIQKALTAHTQAAVERERERAATCPSCGAVYELRVKWEEKRIDYAAETGWPSLTVRVPVWSCNVCDFHWTDLVAEDITEKADLEHRATIRQRASGGQG